ncbi:HPr family phosphocarrier protein [Utexia brackfieldae]
MSLTLNDITLLESMLTKSQAIQRVADNMIAAGLVKADYATAMFDRETQISTFLGNGIAIPHGTTEKRDSVLSTGLKILYSPQGIRWDDDNIAHVVIGIAAKSNEHLAILRQLTRVIIDESALDRIKAVKSAEDLLAILTGQPVVSEETTTVSVDREFTVSIDNPHGLHTRPASMLAKVIKPFVSDIQVTNLDGSNHIVNAKSLMKLVSLGVKSTHRLKFMISGADAAEAEQQIKQAIAQGLGEDIRQFKHSTFIAENQ